MKLLANENLPGAAVDALRERGHDVAWVRTEAPGCRDSEVLERALAERRILVTFDKDFGELAFRSGSQGTTGILLFRVEPKSAGQFARFAVEAFESRDDWAGHFSVIEEAQVRMTPLPGEGDPWS